MRPKLRKILALALITNLLFQQVGFAQIATELNIASHLSRIASSLTVEKFRPAHLRYFSYDIFTNNFKVLLDKGDQNFAEDRSQKTEDREQKNTVIATASPAERRGEAGSNLLQEETQTLLNYFLVGVTLPDSMFWVNLRPDSEDQIIDQYLEKTDVGRIMLEADLQLKKDTSAMTSPATPEGREYWDRLYKKAAELYGYDNVTIPTLTRPWIVPGEIIVRESKDSAYIYKATLKVMLEEDYLKKTENRGQITDYAFKDIRSKALNEYSTQLIKELIIPKLTKEVNSAKRYAPLRQVYYSLILSRWFKQRFRGQKTENRGQKDTVIARSAKRDEAISSRIDSKNLTNLISKQPWSKTTYFQAYQKSFSAGEYNIQEPVYTPTGQVIRSYFSGGIQMDGAGSPINNRSGVINPAQFSPERLAKLGYVLESDAMGMIKPVAGSPLKDQELDYGEITKKGKAKLLQDPLWNNWLMQKILGRSPTHPLISSIGKMLLSEEGFILGIRSSIDKILDEKTLQEANKISGEFEHCNLTLKELVEINSVGKSTDFHQLISGGIFNYLVLSSNPQRQKSGYKLYEFLMSNVRQAYVLIKAVEILSRREVNDKNNSIIEGKNSVGSPITESELAQQLLDNGLSFEFMARLLSALYNKDLLRHGRRNRVELFGRHIGTLELQYMWVRDTQRATPHYYEIILCDYYGSILDIKIYSTLEKNDKVVVKAYRNKNGIKLRLLNVNNDAAKAIMQLLRHAQSDAAASPEQASNSSPVINAEAVRQLKEAKALLKEIGSIAWNSEVFRKGRIKDRIELTSKLPRQSEEYLAKISVILSNTFKPDIPSKIGLPLRNLEIAVRKLRPALEETRKDLSFRSLGSSLANFLSRPAYNSLIDMGVAQLDLRIILDEIIEEAEKTLEKNKETTQIPAIKEPDIVELLTEVEKKIREPLKGINHIAFWEPDHFKLETTKEGVYQRASILSTQLDEHIENIELIFNNTLKGKILPEIATPLKTLRDAINSLRSLVEVVRMRYLYRDFSLSGEISAVIWRLNRIGTAQVKLSQALTKSIKEAKKKNKEVGHISTLTGKDIAKAEKEIFDAVSGIGSIYGERDVFIGYGLEQKKKAAAELSKELDGHIEVIGSNLQQIVENKIPKDIQIKIKENFASLKNAVDKLSKTLKGLYYNDRQDEILKLFSKVNLAQGQLAETLDKAKKYSSSALQQAQGTASPEQASPSSPITNDLKGEEGFLDKESNPVLRIIDEEISDALDGLLIEVDPDTIDGSTASNLEAYLKEIRDGLLKKYAGDMPQEIRKHFTDLEGVVQEGINSLLGKPGFGMFSFDNIHAKGVILLQDFKDYNISVSPAKVLGRFNNSKDGPRYFLMPHIEIPESLKIGKARLAVYQTLADSSVKENYLFAIDFKKVFPSVVGQNIYRPELGEYMWEYGKSSFSPEIEITIDSSNGDLRIESLRTVISETLQEDFEVRLEVVASSAAQSESAPKTTGGIDGSTSSPSILQQSKAPGGIDFRSLPMTIQPMGSFTGLNFKLPKLSQADLARMDIDVELAQIQRMASSGILPSGERVKELIAACIQKQKINAYTDRLLLCLINIFKLQELDAVDSSPALREALVFVDALG